MRRGHKLVHPTGLEMPVGLDASGVPCEGFGCPDPSIESIVHVGGPLESLVHVGAPVARASAPLETVARVPQPPTGLPPTSKIAFVEGVAAEGEEAWLMWACMGDRPVLFSTDAGTAAEMAAALRDGDHATAILEPSQLLLERLD
jgi:hypothetical protein